MLVFASISVCAMPNKCPSSWVATHATWKNGFSSKGRGPHSRSLLKITSTSSISNVITSNVMDALANANSLPSQTTTFFPSSEATRELVAPRSSNSIEDVETASHLLAPSKTSVWVSSQDRPSPAPSTFTYSGIFRVASQCT